MAAGEHRELSAIYLERDLDPALANQVATQLLSHDALGAHARRAWSTITRSDAREPGRSAAA